MPFRKPCIPTWTLCFSLLPSQFAMVISLLYHVYCRFCQRSWIEFFKILSTFLRQILLDTSHSIVFLVVFCLCQYQSCLLRTFTHRSVACTRQQMDLTRRCVLATCLLFAFPYYCCWLFAVALALLTSFAGIFPSRSSVWFSRVYVCRPHTLPLFLHFAAFLRCC